MLKFCAFVCFHILLKVKGPGPVRTLDALNSDCVELCTVLSKCAWLLLELTLHTYCTPDTLKKNVRVKFKSTNQIKKKQQNLDLFFLSYLIVISFDIP